MKKGITQRSVSIIRSSITRILLVAVIISSMPIHSIAQKLSESSPEPVIRYLGKVSDKMLFQVEWKNENEMPFTISIRDSENTVIYSARYSGKNYSRKFQFDEENVRDGSLSFELQRNKSKKVYRVSLTETVIEDVVVTRQ